MGADAGEAATTCRLPASRTQEWLFGSEAAELSTFPVPLIWRIDGELSPRLLADALMTLGQRHEALRTTVALADGEVVQHVAGSPPWGLEHVDLSNARAARRDWPRVVADELRQPFHLRVGPLCRALLLRLTRTDHVLLLLVHHSVTDAMSNTVIGEELRALLGGGTLGSIELQFGDYAAWERSVEVPSTIPDLPPRLGLPVDRSWDISRGFDIVGQAMPELSSTVGHRLRETAVRARTSFAMTLVAGVAASLLGCARDGMLLGVMDANRHRPELAGMVGFLATPLPLRLPVSESMSFEELLTHVHSAWLGTREQAAAGRAWTGLPHGGCEAQRQHPFDVIANPILSPSDGPPIDVQTENGRLRIQELAIADRSLRVAGARGRGSLALIDVQLRPTSRGGISGRVFANRRAISPAAIVGLSGALARILEAVAVRPDRPVRALL